MIIRFCVEVEVENLGDEIRRVRKEDSRTLLAICEEVGLSPTHWHHIENERSGYVPAETLAAIESVLGVDFGVEVCTKKSCPVFSKS